MSRSHRWSVLLWEPDEPPPVSLAGDETLRLEGVRDCPIEGSALALGQLRPVFIWRGLLGDPRIEAVSNDAVRDAPDLWGAFAERMERFSRLADRVNDDSHEQSLLRRNRLRARCIGVRLRVRD